MKDEKKDIKLKILITGGLGFIGSHLADRFYAESERIYLVDNLSTNCIDLNSPFLKREKLNFIQLDLSMPHEKDLKLLDRVIEEVDLVFHFASPVGVKHIDQNPDYYFQSMLKTTTNLLPLFEKHQKRVIFASSSEVYGETLNAKETDSLKIGSPETMRWGYACAKLTSEFLLFSSSFPFVILRFFNTTGPRQRMESGMVMAQFVERALRGEDLIVFDDGEQVRNFCDIRDAIEITYLLSKNLNITREIFNIGNSHNFISIKDLALLVKEKTKSSSQIKFEKYSEHFSNKSADIRSRSMSDEKMRLYYIPQYDLGDIIDSMVATKNAK